MSPESLSVKKNEAGSGQSLCITLSNVVFAVVTLAK